MPSSPRSRLRQDRGEWPCLSWEILAPSSISNSITSDGSATSSSHGIPLESHRTDGPTPVTTKGSTSTTTRVSTTTTATTDVWKYPPNPAPSGNPENHKASFELTAHALNSDSTFIGNIQCEDGSVSGPCNFQLRSSRLYTWYADLVVWVDSTGALAAPVKENEVDLHNLDLDAGFSVGSNSSLFHGDSARWWYCATNRFYVKSRGENCYAARLQVNNTYLD